MLIDIILKDSIDRSVAIKIIDSVSGLPEEAVVHNTAGIALWYRRQGAAKVTITPASLTVLTDAHADGGILHVDDGIYRLDVPDAAFITGVEYVDIGGTVTDMIIIGGRVRLVSVNLDDPIITANLKEINDDADSAIRLALSAKQIIPGTVDTVTNTHTPTVIEFQADDITEATPDHYKNRGIIFTGGPSGLLNNQFTLITAYTLVGGIGQFTVNPLTEPPANNDTFIII